MSSTNARKLVPASSPGVERRLSPEQRASSVSQGNSGIKRASTACQNCKHIKRKCDQHLPCSNCVKTSTECIYDQGQDGRRRAARKRNVEELELKRDALDTLLGALRQSDDVHVQHLLNLIKTDASLEQIIQYANAHQQEIPAEEFSSFAVAVDTSLARKSVLSINALCDTPPIKVPAAPWTRLTHDDDLVSHLVSAYLTWYHTAYHAIAEDLFIQEMSAGDLSSQFCSPILVNAILAIGCFFSDRPGAFGDPNNPSSRGQHFLEESMRLWAKEAGKPRLTTIQAGQCLTIALTLSGKDRLGIIYLNQLHSMADELIFRTQRSKPSNSDDAELWKSLSLAVWCLYLLDVGYSLSFLRRGTRGLPSIQRLSPTDSIFQQTIHWLPYPKTQPAVQSQPGKLANLYYDLHIAGERVATFLFGDTPTSSQAQAQMLRRIEQELDDLSQSIPWPDETDTLNPQIMDVNLVYQWIRMTFFDFTKASRQSASTAETDNLIPHAQQKCLASARVSAQLYLRYFDDFGSRHLTMWMPQTAVTTAYMLIDHIADPEIADVFHAVCSVVVAASRRWFVMRGHARMLLITASEKHQTVPFKTRQLLQRVGIESWGVDEHKLFDAAMLPNYALAKIEDPRLAGMGDLLEQWAPFTVDNLSLDEASKSPENNIGDTEERGQVSDTDRVVPASNTETPEKGG